MVGMAVAENDSVKLLGLNLQHVHVVNQAAAAEPGVKE
jgi:hypothetical protein